MAIVRVDAPIDGEEIVGWMWENINREVETLTVLGPELLQFSLNDIDKIQIDKLEIDYWLKALTAAKKYFEEN